MSEFKKIVVENPVVELDGKKTLLSFMYAFLLIELRWPTALLSCFHPLHAYRVEQCIVVCCAVLRYSVLIGHTPRVWIAGVCCAGLVYVARALCVVTLRVCVSMTVDDR